MTEQLISFKTAKLAKEKGFYIPTLAYCFENGNVGLDYIGEGQFRNVLESDNHNKNGYYINRYSLPTQSLLQKWFREEHEIYIEVMWFGDKDTGVEWDYQISKILDSNPDLSHNYLNEWSDNRNFQTYEEALEEGLFQALKLI